MRSRLRQTRIRKGLQRAWLRIAAVAIACQFLVPTGYMPGSFADGTPFVLCDMFTSVPDQAVSDPHAMHADMADMAPAVAAEHENHSNAEAWERCPLGALGAGAALAFVIQPHIAPSEADQIATSIAALVRSASILTARARAPPIHALNQSV